MNHRLRLLLALFVLTGLPALSFAVSSSSFYYVPPSTATTSYVDISLVNASLVNTSNSTSGSEDVLTIMPDLSLTENRIDQATSMVLLSGPMVYVSTNPALVIDSSTREIVSTISSPEENSAIDAIAVSPDGNYIYVAVSWAEYESDYYGGHYNRYSRIIRLNATTQDPIDYYKFDNIYPWHLEVSPDGKVYLGFQKYGYPNSAGIRIMDFNTGEWWYVDYDQAMVITDFAFSPDGSQVYYNAWWDSSTIYKLDWTTNKGYAYYLPGNFSDYAQYARSIALGIDGKMIYSVLNRNQGIFAMNTQDGGKHMISTDYVPVALTVSPDEQTLYVIGYILDSNNEPIYLIHKYDGLKVIGPYFGAIEDYSLSAGSTFYDYDSMDYISKPLEYYPSKMVVSSDGKYGYIITAKSDSVSYAGSGGPVLVYDLEYMNQLSNIDAENVGYDISAASEKIVHAPTPDYSWLQEFAVSTVNLPEFDTTSIYTKKFYPQNGSYANYTDELFIIYAIFTETLDNATVDNSTFWITDGSGSIVPGYAKSASAIAYFAPYSELENNTDYTAHLSKEISSKDGKPLYADVEWSFTTKSNSSSTTPSSSTVIDFSLIGPVSAVQIGSFIIVPPSETNETNQTANQTEPGQSASQTINQTPGATSSGGEAEESASEAIITPSQSINSSQIDTWQNETEISNQTGSLPGQESEGDGNGELSDIGQETQLNPQPEPPAPKGILESIVDFFKGLLGWN